MSKSEVCWWYKTLFPLTVVFELANHYLSHSLVCFEQVWGPREEHGEHASRLSIWGPSKKPAGQYLAGRGLNPVCLGSKSTGRHHRDSTVFEWSNIFRNYCSGIGAQLATYLKQLDGSGDEDEEQEQEEKYGLRKLAKIMSCRWEEKLFPAEQVVQFLTVGF